MASGVGVGEGVAACVVAGAAAGSLGAAVVQPESITTLKAAARERVPSFIRVFPMPRTLLARADPDDAPVLGKAIASGGCTPYDPAMADMLDPAMVLRSVRGQSPAEETQSQRGIKRLLDEIPALVARAEKLSGSRPRRRSQLDADDTATNPIQMSHLVA
jgi:hypothetical protein